ncbi:hypothetical protein QQY24_07620 [Streptomyces sp. TG1A-8]|uniref:hypothetical protein n=1 Tax=Streptomyces sp. TG1A-8 TaxID=3051385 RepID=UPI00265BB2D6|nr:hypothetical protein [Streptomyces sp. TG1A-8]MDO0925295.1 hypothetical protein [Streptomyces sp. TG1A-8]
MSEQTPSRAEGEDRDTTAAGDEPDTSGHRDVSPPTPSQGEGEGPRDDDRNEEWEAGWSGP